MDQERLRYKERIKDNIRLLVENGRLKEAKELIEHYEIIIKDDVQIYSIKAVIYVIEGNLEGAKENLEKGLLIEPLNSDVLYNLAYVYELEEKYVSAYEYYNKLIYCSDQPVSKEIFDKVRELEKLDQVKKHILEKNHKKGSKYFIKEMKKQIKEFKYMSS